MKKGKTPLFSFDPLAFFKKRSKKIDLFFIERIDNPYSLHIHD